MQGKGQGKKKRREEKKEEVNTSSYRSDEVPLEPYKPMLRKTAEGNNCGRITATNIMKRQACLFFFLAIRASLGKLRSRIRRPLGDFCFRLIFYQVCNTIS